MNKRKRNNLILKTILTVIDENTFEKRINLFKPKPIEKKKNYYHSLPKIRINEKNLVYSIPELENNLFISRVLRLI